VTLTTYAPSGTYSDTSGTQAALDNMRAALMAQKATAATGLMQDIDNWVATMPSDIGQPGWENVQSSQFNAIVKNREDQVVAAIANQISASEGDVNGGVNAFISDMTKGGWAIAGGWYQRAGLLRSKLSTITSESVGNVSSPSFSSLPDDARTKLLRTASLPWPRPSGRRPNWLATVRRISLPKPEDMATLLPKDANSDVNVGALDADMSTKTTLREQPHEAVRRPGHRQRFKRRCGRTNEDDRRPAVVVSGNALGC
jgi:conjugal transfer/type IV secretion protein DotA/TraY